MEDNFARIFNLTFHISNQFIRFIEDNFFTNVNGCSEDLVINSSGEGSGSVSRSSCNSVFEGISSSSIHYETARIPGIHGRRSSNVKEFPVISTTGTSINDNCRYIRFFFQGILSRVQMTLLGSSDDIGWLQTSPGMAPVVDGTARFLELLQRIRNGEHMLPELFVYLLIPGLFSNHGPLYFVSTKRFFSNMGLACHIAKIHSEASVEHNARELKQYIDELYWGSGKRVMLLGHSKGGVDAAAALSIYWSDLKDKVAGLALVQSPYGGTPIASDILRKGQLADKETRRVMEFLICKLIKGDLRSVEDLTYEKRREFILKHKLPEQIPLISFHSEAHIGLGVLTTLTQVGHVELPWLPLLTCAGEASKEDDSSIWSARRVPVVMPISAAMAICALHLLLRYGEKSDGLVTCRDAEVPGSVVIRPDRKLDHGRMVHSSWKKNPDEPDACEMCEAILTLLVELGKAKH